MLGALVIGLPSAVPAFGAPAGAGGSASSAASETGQGNLALLDLVFLVDESGSETTQKVADEKATVGTIVQSLLNPDSRVTVIGFGGVNHVAPNQVPTDVACVPTIASGAANLDYLSTCVSKLHRRTEAEGDDTDYAAALSQAMSYLSPASTATPPSPAGAHKIIIMMTDGAVDVFRNTQQYGTNWQLGEQTAINQQLSAAKTGGVQFWPLGFGTQDIGTNVDGTTITVPEAKAYLNGMAAQAAPSICGTKETAVQPHATWVNNPDDAINAINQLYADASCGAAITTPPQPLPSGGTVTLSVTIPQIASAAAISVARGAPAVSVSFQPPSGAPLSNSPVMTGEGSAVETLHLYNVTAADVGTWHLTLTAPANLASELVRATVFWQGAVRALTTVSPPNAKLGQQVKVTLDVLGPNGPITDPATISSMLVGETVTGNGLAGTVGVPVTAVSGSPGEWSGVYTVPDQSTTLTFAGTASGYGLYTTEVSATVGVGTQSQGLTATPDFTGGNSVQAGGTIPGQVVLTNQTGSAQHVKLEVTASGATVALTSPNGPVTVASGSPPAVPFAINVAKDSPIGTALVQVTAVNAATGQVINTAQQNFTITKPPGFLARYWWLLPALVVIIVLAVLAWKTRRDRKNVRGLVAMLRKGGVPTGRDLEVDEKYSEVLSFIIRDEASPAPRLDHPGKGSSVGVYQVRRAGRGLVRLTTPTGLRPSEVEVGGAGLELGNGLQLAFRDARHPDWTGTGRIESVGGPGDWSGSGPGTAPPTNADDWSGSAGGGGATDWSGSGTYSGTANWAGGPSYGAAAPTAPGTPPPPPPPRGYGNAMPTMPMGPPPPPPPPPPPSSPDPWA